MTDFVDKFIKRTNWKLGNFSMLPIAFGVAMALLDICMLSLTKLVSIGKLSYWTGMPLAVGIYGLQPIVCLKSVQYGGIIATNLVWNLVSDIIVTLQGIFVFGESIKGLRWVGIGMSFVALSIFAYTDTS
jgi:hypothetical protein